MPSPPHASSLDEVLMSHSMLNALARSLDKAWRLPLEQGRILLNHPYEGDPTGASVDTGKGLLTFLTGFVSHGEKVTKGNSLIGTKNSGQVMHAHSIFCMSSGNYIEPDLWGILGPLPYHGTPAYIHITPLHLAASFSFIGVLRTEFDSALAGLSKENNDLNDLIQEHASKADDDSRRIQARGACFLPSELVGALYNLGVRPIISDVAPWLFTIGIALGKDNTPV